MLHDTYDRFSVVIEMRDMQVREMNPAAMANVINSRHPIVDAKVVITNRPLVDSEAIEMGRES